VTMAFSPLTADWNYGNIPDVEDVPHDCSIAVWTDDYIGTMIPWGDKKEPTRWAGVTVAKGFNCIDGKWSKWDEKTNAYVWEVRNVWWTWIGRGTAGRMHPYPTWRQVNGRL